MQVITLQTLLVCWLNFVLLALPSRVISTYAELLVGAIISTSGHITDALLAVGHRKHFSTYYWLIERASWSWLRVSRQLVRLIIRWFPRNEWNVIVDDFICARTSKNAPEVKCHPEHSKKPNRPKYIWGQQWVALSLSLTWGKMCVSLPLLLRLHKHIGNSTKLTTGVALVRAVFSLFRKDGKETIRCLVDAWYMKGRFVLTLLKYGIHVIGQVRKDTALFEAPDIIPQLKRKPGRPRKYGKKLTPEQVEKLPIHKAMINVYGNVREVKYRAIKCLARFLKGRAVMAVWCQLPEQKGWSLILSTDLSLTPERIIKLYARRWKTEPMFNEIKHGYGVAEAWERTTQNLHRWVSMLCVAYTLTRMLSVIAATPKHQESVPLIQWRANRPVTAGLVRIAIQLFFKQFSFSQLWVQKSKKFRLPVGRNTG